jgi:hypothetical protein
MSMRVLVLGARAPAALEWVRGLAGQGVSVYAADSLALPFTRFSRYLKEYFRLPEPRHQPEEWIDALVQLAIKHNIDWIIPTCEEVFYLAWGASRFQGICRLFTSDFDLLHRLHHKGEFAQLVQRWSLQAPTTQTVKTIEELASFSDQTSRYVFKPAYSRFATSTLISPTPEALKLLKPTAEQPWVVQERIRGEEFCSYSLLREGQLLAHSVYQPRHRVGQGSGIYFEQVEITAIEPFVRSFGQLSGYTGQLAFDWMCDQQQNFWVLECNPRATSGIHLFDDQPEALLGALAPVLREDQPVFYPSHQPRMVALAMLMFAGRKLLQKNFWKDFSRAEDVICRKGDAMPLLAQLPGMMEISMRALMRGCSLLAASTADIEWDGQPLGSKLQRL